MARSRFKLLIAGVLLATGASALAAPGLGFPPPAAPPHGGGPGGFERPGQAPGTFLPPGQTLPALEGTQLSPQEAARQAQLLNGGGRVLSVDATRGGWRVKLLTEGDVRSVFVPD